MVVLPDSPLNMLPLNVLYDHGFVTNGNCTEMWHKDGMRACLCSFVRAYARGCVSLCMCVCLRGYVRVCVRARVCFDANQS